MTSRAAAESPLPRVQGLVFLGFPLHAAGNIGTERVNHLASVDLLILFLQSPWDRLANLDLLRPICRQLGNRAVLHAVGGADYSFRVTVEPGRTGEETFSELATSDRELDVRLRLSGFSVSLWSLGPYYRDTLCAYNDSISRRRRRSS